MQTLRTFEAPVAFTGSPNEGMDYLAGGRSAIPSFETHNDDISLPEQTVSRFDLWRRRLTNNNVARLAFLALSVSPIVAACADDGGDRPAIVDTYTSERPAPSNPNRDPHCYDDFASLSAVEQQECRQLIADMDPTDISQLPPLDYARWAGYYRFAKLGEPRPAQIEIAAVIDSKKQSIIHSTATRLLMTHQDNIFRIAWLLQNNPSICTDSRTLMATLGSPDVQDESYKMAQSVASLFPTGGRQLNTYMIALQTESPLFGTISLDNPNVHKKDSVFELTFQANTKTTNTQQHFSFTMLPYMDVWPEGALYKEGFAPDDPAFAVLKDKLIVSPPKITG